MKDYHNVYLKCDVLLLADVFGRFRNNSLKNYGLCPSHYLSAPALSQKAIFNMTKVELELISDADMYLFFEKGMRGGVSYISERYSKANKQYLKPYDSKQESKQIIYSHANNLYGYPKSKLLLTNGLKWIDPNNFDLNRCSTNSSKRCVLEVVLEYTQELRELNNDYPLAPDKIEIKRKMLSNYQIKITDFYDILITTIKKLVPNLFDKEKHVLHYENLQFYLRLNSIVNEAIKTIFDLFIFKKNFEA